MAESNSSSGAVRALIFLALAVAMGSGALVVLYQLITNYQQKIDEARRPEDMVMVIVAARDLYQGVTVTEDDLYAVQIEPRYLPEGVFLSPEHVVGRIPRERILANEFVRADRLADPESGVGLNAVIPRGMRAISVNVTDGAALSGFLNPGNYVDVLVTYQPDEGAANQTVKTNTILQAVFVLGVNSRRQNESTDAARELRPRQRPSVTLLVTADQAEKVAHAEHLGQIVLSLRNDLDVNLSSLRGVDLNDLRRKLEAPVIIRPTRKVPKKQCRELKQIQGDNVKIVLVDENGELCDR